MIGTAASWLEGLSYNHAWEQERDTPRVRAAFSYLIRTSSQWPQPKHLLEALPPKPELPRVAYMGKPSAEGLAKMKELVESLRLTP